MNEDELKQILYDAYMEWQSDPKNYILENLIKLHILMWQERQVKFIRKIYDELRLDYPETKAVLESCHWDLDNTVQEVEKLWEFRMVL